MGGVPEFIHDNDNGILIPPGDVDALTEALRRLILDRELVQRLGQAARETIEVECDLDLVGKALVELYRGALRGGGSGQTSTEMVNTWRRVSSQHDG